MSMKTWFAVSVIVVSVVRAPAQAPGPFSNAVGDVAAYVAEVQALAADKPTDTKGKTVSVYLEDCVQNARILHAGISPQATDADANILAFRSFMESRRLSLIALPDDKASTSSVVNEGQLYRDHIMPYLKNPYYSRKRAEVELFKRKYFEDDDPRSANLVEGWANGHYRWLKYSEDAPDRWHRSHGVSAWEMTFRVEPVVVFDGDETLGALFALGWLYTAFPTITATDDGGIHTQETLASKWLRRTGLRLGAGVDLNDDPHFIGGIGLQIRAWTLWSIYREEPSEWYAAIGLSDWEWLKPYLPAFGKTKPN